MHITITETMFIEEFRTMDRMDNFSVDALRKLYEYFTDMEAELDQMIECDVIAICCDWSEDTVEDIVSNYDSLRDIVDDPEGDIDEAFDDILEALNNETIAFDTGNGKILYQNF